MCLFRIETSGNLKARWLIESRVTVTWLPTIPDRYALTGCCPPIPHLGIWLSNSNFWLGANPYLRRVWKLWADQHQIPADDPDMHLSISPFFSLWYTSLVRKSMVETNNVSMVRFECISIWSDYQLRIIHCMSISPLRSHFVHKRNPYFQSSRIEVLLVVSMFKVVCLIAVGCLDMHDPISWPLVSISLPDHRHNEFGEPSTNR